MRLAACKEDAGKHGNNDHHHLDRDDYEDDHNDNHDNDDQVFNCSALRLASCIEAAGKGEIVVEGKLETNILIIKVKNEKWKKGKRGKRKT